MTHSNLHATDCLPWQTFVSLGSTLADYLLVPALLYAFSATWLNGLLPAVPARAWVLAFVSFNTGVNVLGIKLQAQAHFALLVVELIALAIFLVFAIHFVFFARHGTAGWSITPFFQPQHLDGRFIATATSIAVLSFRLSALTRSARWPRKRKTRARS
ncbi:hypothetical protein [Metallibacterium sp.]